MRSRHRIVPNCLSCYCATDRLTRVGSAQVPLAREVHPVTAYVGCLRNPTTIQTDRHTKAESGKVVQGGGIWGG